MKKYKYQMRHQWIGTTAIGLLKPCFVQEVTPNDTWYGSSTAVFRLAPIDFPAYTTLSIFVKFYYVPHRLTFPEFPEVFAGTDTSTAWPTITYSGIGTYWTDFGVALNMTSTPEMNALPVRALNLVWNEYFRNANTTNEISLDTIASPLRVNFSTNDYYGGITTEIQQGTVETVDSSGATIDIPDIRDAFHRQNLAERRALYGERYRDVLKADYNVNASDMSLDRPEFVAQGKTTIGISEVVATATSTNEETGEIRGHGIGGMRINFPKRNFEEPGTLIGVYYCRPRLQLNTACDKLYTIDDRDQLHIPSLSNDTQVNVLNREVYHDVSTPDANFGYQFRDEWLRTPRDVIAGAIKGTANDGWYTAVELSALPTAAFLQQVQDYDSMFQDQTSTRMDITSYFNHRIGKQSVIKPRTKR